MKEALLAAVAALGLTFVASTVQAVTISETTDFSDSTGSPTALGTLDLGLNSISGTVNQFCDRVTGSCSIVLGDDTDAFSVDIAPGTHLTDVVLNVLRIQGGDLNVDGSLFDLAFPPSAGTFNLLSADSATGTAVFDVFFQHDGRSTFADARYRFDLTVAALPGSPSAVPLPAGLPLFLAGLGGFAFLRKRKAT